jgi:hypothetical protein
LALAVLHGQNCIVNAHVLSTQKRVLAVQERYALSVPSQQQGGGGFPRVTRIPEYLGELSAPSFQLDFVRQDF